MSLLIDAIVISLIGYAAFAGSRRGLLLVALEFGSLIISTVAAYLLCIAASPLIAATGLSMARSRLLGFVVLLILFEVGTALVIRFTVLPRYSQQTGHGTIGRGLGAALNAIKMGSLLVIALVAYNNLPLSSSTKDVLIAPAVSRLVLSQTGGFQDWWRTGPGRDITESLSFFVITTDPESQQRIELSFRTSSGQLDATAEQTMLGLINQERTQRGLNALTTNTGAQAVARDYSREMLTAGYFSHIDNAGHNPFDRLRAAGVQCGAAGENLALAPSLRRAHNGLMNSPGHRANILSPDYHTVGIGIIDAGQYGIMVTQDFTD